MRRERGWRRLWRLYWFTRNLAPHATRKTNPRRYPRRTRRRWTKSRVGF